MGLYLFIQSGTDMPLCQDFANGHATRDWQPSMRDPRRIRPSFLISLIPFPTDEQLLPLPTRTAIQFGISQLKKLAIWKDVA
jgi:hypothetical protein